MLGLTNPNPNPNHNLTLTPDRSHRLGSESTEKKDRGGDPKAPLPFATTRR